MQLSAAGIFRMIHTTGECLACPHGVPFAQLLDHLHFYRRRPACVVGMIIVHIPMCTSKRVPQRPVRRAFRAPSCHPASELHRARPTEHNEHNGN